MSASRFNSRATVFVVVDFASLGLVSGSASAARQNVLAHHRRTFTKHLKSHRGTVLRSFQPRAVAEFSEASEALDCVLEAKDAIERQNEVLPSTERVHICVGIHMGELATNEPVLSSDLVSHANQLINIADVGGITVSNPVHDGAPKYQALMVPHELGSDTGDGKSARVFIVAGLAPPWNAVPVADAGGNDLLPLPDVASGVPIFGGDDDDAGDEKADVSCAQVNNALEIIDYDDEDGTVVSLTRAPAPEPGPLDDDTTLTENPNADAPPGRPPPPHFEPYLNDETDGTGRITEAELFIAKASAYAADNELYHAIENYGRAAGILSTVPGQKDRMLGLNERCESIQAGFGFTGDAVLELADCPMLLRLGSELQVGRRDADRLDELHVGCELVSRIGSQARIVFEDGEYRITDLGSTNGTFLGDRLVKPGQPTALEQGVDLRFGGGLNSPKPGPCVLQYRRFGGAVSALVLSFSSAGGGSADAAYWPSMEADCRYRWILTPGPLLIGGSEDCPLLPSEAPAEILARMSFDNGYVLEPASDHSVVVNGAAVTRPVKLVKDARLEIGGSQITLRANADYFSEHPPA